MILYVIVAADFTLTTSMVTFGPGDTSGNTKCFEFNLIQDDMLEGDEAFTVVITDFGGANQGAITEATVIIDDDDG